YFNTGCQTVARFQLQYVCKSGLLYIHLCNRKRRVIFRPGGDLHSSLCVLSHCSKYFGTLVNSPTILDPPAWPLGMSLKWSDLMQSGAYCTAGDLLPRQHCLYRKFQVHERAVYWSWTTNPGGHSIGWFVARPYDCGHDVFDPCC